MKGSKLCFIEVVEHLFCTRGGYLEHNTTVLGEPSINAAAPGSAEEITLAIHDHPTERQAAIAKIWASEGTQNCFGAIRRYFECGAIPLAEDGSVTALPGGAVDVALAVEQQIGP